MSNLFKENQIIFHNQKKPANLTSSADNLDTESINTNTQPKAPDIKD